MTLTRGLTPGTCWETIMVTAWQNTVAWLTSWSQCLHLGLTHPTATLQGPDPTPMNTHAPKTGPHMGSAGIQLCGHRAELGSNTSPIRSNLQANLSLLPRVWCPAPFTGPCQVPTRFCLELAFLGGREPACHCRRRKRCRFDPWIGKIPLGKEMATRSSILAWKIPWTEEPGGLWSMESQRVRHSWIDLAHSPRQFFLPGLPSFTWLILAFPLRYSSVGPSPGNFSEELILVSVLVWALSVIQRSLSDLTPRGVSLPRPTLPLAPAQCHWGDAVGQGHTWTIGPPNGDATQHPGHSKRALWMRMLPASGSSHPPPDLSCTPLHPHQRLAGGTGRQVPLFRALEAPQWYKKKQVNWWKSLLFQARPLRFFFNVKT